MSFEDPEKKDSLDHGDDISRPDTGRRKSSMSRRKNSAYEDPFSRKEDVDEGEMQDAEIDYQSMEWWYVWSSPRAISFTDQVSGKHRWVCDVSKSLFFPSLTTRSYDRWDHLSGYPLVAFGACKNRPCSWTHLDSRTRYYRDIHWLGKLPQQHVMTDWADCVLGHWPISNEVSLGEHLSQNNKQSWPRSSYHLGRIIRRCWRDSLQTAQDGRHRSRVLRRSTNDLPDLHHGQSHFDMDNLSQHRHRQCYMHRSLGCHRIGSLLHLRPA